MNCYAILTIYTIKEENSSLFTHIELLEKVWTSNDDVMHYDACSFM